MSGVLFCEMLIRHTSAECDQEHLNFIMSSRADTPDRTAFILGRSATDPSPVMLEEVKRLTDAGADIIAIPCNTAHYFYESVSRASSVPVINIISQTAQLCKQMGLCKVGVLSTEGTARSGAYKSVLEGLGLECITCTDEEQAVISSVIYDGVKKGRVADIDGFMRVAEALRQRGCQRLILGCTELSVLKRELPIGSGFIDSLEVLAVSAIRMCGKEPRDLDEELMNFKIGGDNGHVTK